MAGQGKAASKRATGTAQVRGGGGNRQVSVREVKVEPELGGMTQHQLNAINERASRGIPSVGLPHAPMDVGEYCDRMHNNGTSYPVLYGFKSHMLRLLDSASDELRRDQWDALFNQYSGSDDSPENPMPTRDDIDELRSSTPAIEAGVPEEQGGGGGGDGDQEQSG